MLNKYSHDREYKISKVVYNLSEDKKNYDVKIISKQVVLLCCYNIVMYCFSFRCINHI